MTLTQSLKTSTQGRGSAVEFREVSKHYGNFEALKPTNLSIKAGEFLSILGPSGSGKSTMLMMLAGFETPTRGNLIIGDRDVTLVPPNKRDIGMVFQRYALFPHMTVAQNIAFPLKMRGFDRSRRNKMVERVIELVQLGRFRDRMPAELSGGQQQRVAVARALVFEPPVILMDEPLGALDKKLREDLQFEIKNLHREVGVTIVYVTHDQEEALTMSDRIAVMSEGRIRQIGSPKELYFHADSRFVANFLGKMNFITARYIERVGDICQFEIANTLVFLPASALAGEILPGQTACLAIRPESIKASKAEVPNKSIKATVYSAIFVGSFVEYRARLSNGETVELHLPATNILHEGEQISLNFSPDDVRVFETAESVND